MAETQRQMILWWIAPAVIAAQPLVIRNANVIDGVSTEPIREATVVVEGGKIVSIGGAPTPAPSGADVVDARGRWLLPGWVDAHVHIASAAQASVALRSGVTTARSMGVSNFADVGMRELNRGGSADICDIVASGYHIRPSLAPEFFLDFPGLRDLMRGLSGTANVRRAVRAVLDRGVNVIKVLATERAGLPNTDPRKRTFTDEELAAIVDEAATRGIPVAAHAHGDEGAAAAVRAGVRSIEHGTFLTDATLREMKKRGTFLVPTIATVEDLTDPGGDYDDPVLMVRGRAMLPRVRETARLAYSLGVRLVAGTDTGYAPRSVRRIPDEVIALHRVGLSPMQAIGAGTSLSAELLGVGNRTGSIRIGLEADMILVDRDPLADISALHDVVAVINNGQVVVHQRER